MMGVGNRNAKPVNPGVVSNRLTSQVPVSTPWYQERGRGSIKPKTIKRHHLSPEKVEARKSICCAQPGMAILSV